MFKDISLVQRIGSLAILSIISVTIIVLISVNSTRIVDEDFDRVINEDARKVSLSKDIKLHLTDMNIAEKNIILAQTTQEMNAHIKSFDAAKREIYLKVPRLRYLLLSQQNKEKLDEFKVNHEKYVEVFNEIANLNKKGLKEQALALSTSKANRLILKGQNDINSILDVNEKIMQDSRLVAKSRYDNTTQNLFLTLLFLAAILIYFGVNIYRYINKRLSDIYTKIDVINSGDFTEFEDSITTSDELGKVSSSISDTIKLLKNNSIELSRQSWIKEGVNHLNSELSGETDMVKVGNKAINFLCNYINAGVGLIYKFDEDVKELVKIGSYAYVQREDSLNVFKLGEGTVGQVALQKSPIHLKNINQVQLLIDTGSVSEIAANSYTFPLVYQNELLGVIEIGSNEIFDEKVYELLNLTNLIIATTMYTASQGEKVKDLLAESVNANVRMQEQQLQLEEANAQMEEQQQQLEEANSQMVEQQQQLKNSSLILEEKNRVLEYSQKELDKKADDLELSNKYKSEFLANMSHELRTPLNSIILLSDLLQSNNSTSMDKEELKKASIIHDSGNELLRLINDVLDLSKIEAGMMSIMVDEFDSEAICTDMKKQFEYIAQEKNLDFVIVDEYKGKIVSDKDKISQVLRNLISNSLKFTKDGSVTLKLVATEDNRVAMSVTDTGIGIPEEKLEYIFDVFQQADGGISREYGGTGLGLSISKELVKMMGGEMTLESKDGGGSTFTIIVPSLYESLDTSVEANFVKKPAENSKTKYINNSQNIVDDRRIINALDKPFLIIEDDMNFAYTLRETINSKNEYALIALNGEDGLKLALEYDVKGVLLDLKLPDMDGIDVLKEFKTNKLLRKIPVYIVSGEHREQKTKEHGAIGYAHKPLGNNEIITLIDKVNSFNNKKVKDLLVVEDSSNEREAIIEFIGNGTIKSKGVGSVKEAISELDRGIYDCVIVDLSLGNESGYDICEYIKENNLEVPIIIYTGSDLTPKEEAKLRTYTDSIIIKTVASQNRLLDEVDIFMHRVKINTGVTNENIMDIDLTGEKILVVDDDIRNIYVLSEALSSKGATVITANNGQEAIEILNNSVDISMILMDIMMPVMDGYEAIKVIKSDEKTKNIPTIAVTAKAMHEDKENAMKAGFDDYISKPLKMDVLVSIIKGWLDNK